MAAANASGADMVQAAQDIQKLIESLSAAPDPAKAPASGYAPVYYPGTTVGANATAVTLGSLSYWEDQLIDRMRKKNAA